MLNHVRTLLLNQAWDAQPGPDFPGEELIPNGFGGLELPSYLDRLRGVLFGADPDREYLNYRLRQFMALLHATPLVEFVTSLDPRISYNEFLAEDLYSDALFLPRFQQVSGNEGTQLFFQGAPVAPDSAGRMRFLYTINVLSPDTVEVERTSSPPQAEILDLNFQAGLSGPVALAGSGYSCKLTSDSPAESWRITIHNRPQRELGELAARLRSIGEQNLLKLFGPAPREPYRTFRNLWEQHPELPFSLGGLLLAMAYRTEEVRRGQPGQGA